LEESILDTSELIELRKAGQLGIDGYSTIFNFIEFPKAAEFERLKVLYPTKEDYDTALVWSASLLRRGKPVPAIDLLISAVAARTGLQLVTRDSHFREIKAIAKGFTVQIKH